MKPIGLLDVILSSHHPRCVSETTGQQGSSATWRHLSDDLLDQAGYCPEALRLESRDQSSVSGHLHLAVSTIRSVNGRLQANRPTSDQLGTVSCGTRQRWNRRAGSGDPFRGGLEQDNAGNSGGAVIDPGLLSSFGLAG